MNKLSENDVDQLVSVIGRVMNSLREAYVHDRSPHFTPIETLKDSGYVTELGFHTYQDHLMDHEITHVLHLNLFNKKTQKKIKFRYEIELDTVPVLEYSDEEIRKEFSTKDLDCLN